MPIRNRDEKMMEVIQTILDGLPEIEDLNEIGPSLYFYRKTMDKRRHYDSVTEFLADDNNIELLYTTLVSWNMDSRRAKMLYFDDFKDTLISCCSHFQFLEQFPINDNADWEEYLSIISELYDHLKLMQSDSRLVSNSKLLHFLFPDQFMPMDGLNTLDYLYKNNYESVGRYIEIFEFMFDILEILYTNYNPEEFLDDLEYQSVPKLIDNAIIELHEL
jgi:hypothetical protein